MRGAKSQPRASQEPRGVFFQSFGLVLDLGGVEVRRCSQVALSSSTNTIREQEASQHLYCMQARSSPCWIHGDACHLTAFSRFLGSKSACSFGRRNETMIQSAGKRRSSEQGAPAIAWAVLYQLVPVASVSPLLRWRLKPGIYICHCAGGIEFVGCEDGKG